MSQTNNNKNFKNPRDQKTKNSKMSDNKNNDDRNNNKKVSFKIPRDYNKGHSSRDPPPITGTPSNSGRPPVKTNLTSKIAECSNNRPNPMNNQDNNNNESANSTDNKPLPVKYRIFSNQFYKLGNPASRNPNSNDSSPTSTSGPLGPSPVANNSRLGGVAKSVIEQLSNYRPGANLPDKVSPIFRKALNMKDAKLKNHPNYNKTKNKDEKNIQSSAGPSHTPNEISGSNSSNAPCTSSPNSVTQDHPSSILAEYPNRNPHFRKKYGRRKDKINVILPQHGFFTCTEFGCNKIIIASTLHSARKYLADHLESKHRLCNLVFFYYCSICGDVVDGRIPHHPCFKKYKYYIVDQSQVILPSKCTHCDHSFETNKELLRHKIKYIVN